MTWASVNSLPAEYDGMTTGLWRGEFPRQLAEWRGDPTFVLITGKPGNGKTHLAVAALRDAAADWLVKDRPERGTYRPLDAPPPVDLLPRLFVLPIVLDRMRDLIEDGGDQSLAHKLRLSRLAVIDDWGAERRTDWTADLLLRIVVERHVSQRPTIFTTNQSPDEIFRAEPRLASRLLSGLVIQCEGPDRRLEALRERIVRVQAAP